MKYKLVYFLALSIWFLHTLEILLKTRELSVGLVIEIRMQFYQKNIAILVRFGLLFSLKIFVH